MEAANGAKSKKTNKGGRKGQESANGANDSASKKPHCHNCENNKALLKKYGKKPHKTNECPFEQSRKQREYYQKDKIIVDKSSFPEFAHGSQEGEESDSQDE